MCRIVAFLQNQYFHNPAKVREIYARNPEMRERLNRQFLFAGCLTGRRLLDTFGTQRCQDIIWEEITKEIGGQSNAAFAADQEHICQVLHKHQPGIVLTFGSLAKEALYEWVNVEAERTPPQPLPAFVHGPHPAARYPDIVEQLEDMAAQVAHLELEIFGIARDRRGCYAVREDG